MCTQGHSSFLAISLHLFVTLSCYAKWNQAQLYSFLLNSSIVNMFDKLCLIFLLTDLSFITTVYLICNKFDQLSIKEERNNSLKLNLQTICACPDGCHSVMNTFSPGTYIVIVFTSVMLSYLILGKSTLFLFIFCIRSVLVTLWMIVNTTNC